MNKKILYIDMDNVIVDFESGINRLPKLVLERHIKAQGLNEQGQPRNLDDIHGIFALMDPMPGAIEAVTELADLFETYVLSSSPWNNPSAWSDKLKWIRRHFGAGANSPLYKRLILSHHKNLNDGQFLIDDRLVNGAQLFGQRPDSRHIHFGQPGFEDWQQVLVFLREHF